MFFVKVSSHGLDGLGWLKGFGSNVQGYSLRLISSVICTDFKGPFKVDQTSDKNYNIFYRLIIKTLLVKILGKKLGSVPTVNKQCKKEEET